MPDGILYDGDFTVATQVGAIRISRPLPHNPLAFVLRVEHWQAKDNWLPQALNTLGPGADPNSYLVDETELQDLEYGLVKWDRVYATIPGPYTEQGSIVKTYKYLQKQWTSGALSAVSIATQTRTVLCNIVWDYSLDPSAWSLPAVPDVSVNSVGVFTYVWNTGGFPFNGAEGSPVDSNNFYHFITGEIGIYMGKIYYRKRIYA